MIILIDTENASDKNLSFIHDKKTFSTLGIEGNLLILIMGIYKKQTS